MVKKIVLLMASLFFSTVHGSLVRALPDSTVTKKRMVNLEGLKNAIKEGSGLRLMECVKNGLIDNHELIKDEDFPVFFYTLCVSQKFDRAKEVLKLKDDFDLNFHGLVGKTPLHLAAAWSKDTDFIEMLVNKGANKDALDNYKLTPLHCAVWCRMENKIKRLLKIGVKTDFHCGLVNLDARYNGWTPLHFAVINFHTAIALLLDAGADINAVDAQGNTPLHLACLKSKSYCVKDFLEAGVDYKLKNKYGHTPLHVAANVGDHLSVKELLAKGANVDAKDLFERTPLHLVVCGKNLYTDLKPCDLVVKCTIEALLEGDANVDEKDIVGRTALHEATKRWIESKKYNFSNDSEKEECALAFDIVKKLLQNGACADVCDDLGKTPLSMVISHSRSTFIATNDSFILPDVTFNSMVKLLLDGGANPQSLEKDDKDLLLRFQIKNSKLTVRSFAIAVIVSSIVGYIMYCGLTKQTKLHTAASNGNRDEVNTLLGQGADKNACDSHGRTPLHCAAVKGHSGVVKELLDSGADKEIKDNDGKTAMQLASDNGHVEVVKLFVRYRNG